MRKCNPLVSIGLPVYNGENFIAEAIECVQSQTFSDWELIISDNNSTDHTLLICRDIADKDSRIRIYQNTRNMGVLPNYNKVFQLSRGKYFKWMAHDDLFGGDFIASCIGELEDRQNALAFPRIVSIDINGRLISRQEKEDLSIISASAESRVWQLMSLLAQSTDILWAQFGLIRRSILEETRLMDLYSGSDQVLLLEISLRGNLKQISRELFYRRVHPSASTLRRGWTAKDRALFANADDRRRVVFPNCRMMKEHFARIWNYNMSSSAKVKCNIAIMGRYFKHWKYFVHELIDSPLDAMSGKYKITKSI
jgi:glycosyltransferase involved in cell wall biosynthesis